MLLFPIIMEGITVEGIPKKLSLPILTFPDMPEVEKKLLFPTTQS